MRKQPKTREEFMALPIIQLADVEEKAFYIEPDTLYSVPDETGTWKLVKDSEGRFARICRL